MILMTKFHRWGVSFLEKMGGYWTRHGQGGAIMERERFQHRFSGGDYRQAGFPNRFAKLGQTAYVG